MTGFGYAQTALGRLHYAEAGSGPPLLLMHASARSHRSFRHMLPLLAPRFRTVAVDLPGFGASAPLPRGTSIEAMAGAIAEFLDACGLGRAHVFGLHTGNKIAVYPDAKPDQPALTYYHRGARNAEALAHWMAKNMRQPEHLLLTGFSAGGAGSTANYGILRDIVKPKAATLLADSGPLMQAPRGSTAEQAPSLRLHEKIRSAWGLDGPEGKWKWLFVPLVAPSVKDIYEGNGDVNENLDRWLGVNLVRSLTVDLAAWVTLGVAVAKTFGRTSSA